MMPHKPADESVMFAKRKMNRLYNLFDMNQWPSFYKVHPLYWLFCLGTWKHGSNAEELKVLLSSWFNMYCTFPKLPWSTSTLRRKLSYWSLTGHQWQLISLLSFLNDYHQSSKIQLNNLLNFDHNDKLLCVVAWWPDPCLRWTMSPLSSVYNQCCDLWGWLLIEIDYWTTFSPDLQ